MEWVFAALIVGSIVYIGMILIEVTNYTMQISPRIQQLNERAEVLDERCEQEQEAVAVIKDRAAAARVKASELGDRLTDLRSTLNKEYRRKQQLEMEYFKVRLRNRRPVMA